MLMHLPALHISQFSLKSREIQGFSTWTKIIAVLNLDSIFLTRCKDKNVSVFGDSEIQSAWARN